tara:strand:- start:9918 stop:10544 length:627 start_codon:yes stop_codon:yes gene_type:complete
VSDYKNLKVGIINLKLNNIFSIYQLFNYFNSKITIIDEYANLKKFDIVILPGDGAFKEGMKKLNNTNLNDQIINYSSLPKKKILGICLGMQLLLETSSEFGLSKGLSLIKGKVDKLPNNNALVPNIGWNKLKSKNKLFNKFNNKFFYFSHSFYAKPSKLSVVGSYINFGKKKICTSLIDKNIFGIQFHPEKSHMDGIKLVKKILDIEL